MKMNPKAGLYLLLASVLVPLTLQAETKVSGEIEAGYQKKDVSANESKFEEYGETPDGVVIPHVKVQSTGDHDQTTFEGTDLRQNNQSFDLDYNHDYKVKVDASWNQTPHDYSNVGSTLYNETSPGVFRLPDQVQSNMQSLLNGKTSAQAAVIFNSTMTSLMGAAHNAALHTQDNQGAVNLGFRVGESVKMSLGASEDRIEGYKPKGTTFGTSYAIQLPQPVDWKVYNMNAGTQYASKDVQVGINYAMSAFKNNIESMTWDNPKQFTDANSNPSQGRISLAPDNWSNTVKLNGGVNLPAKTRFTATGSMGYLRQNSDLLPFSINSRLAQATVSDPSNVSSLPESSANANMLTWMQDYALTNKVVKPLTLGVHYHSYQMVNGTTEAIFAGRSTADTTWSTGPYTNNRFEFRKDTLEGGADWQVFDPWALGVKYGTEWDHRTDREVTDTTEKTLKATTDVKLARSVLLRGSYIRAHRRPQDFESPTISASNSFSDQPGLRRYDVADRLRDQGRVTLQMNPGPVSMSVNGSLTHDNFQPGIGDMLSGINTAGLTVSTTQQAVMYGLLESRDASVGGDIGWDFSDRLSFDTYYQYEETRSLQRSNSAGVTLASAQKSQNDWSVRSLERYHVAGIAANVGAPKDRVKVRLGYDITLSRGANDFINTGSLVVPATLTNNGAAVTLTPGVLLTPADTKYSKQDITVRTNIRMSERVDLVLGYLYEKYDVTDWQNQNVPLVGGVNAGSQTNIYLGDNLQNYVAHVGSVVVKYKF